MKIMLVDDHALFAEGLRYVIEEMMENVSCIIALDAEAALEMLSTDQDYALILVDLSMPGIDGVSLLQSITSRKLTIPAAVLSASEDVQLIRAALDEGAFGFLPKSLDKEALRGAIQCILEGSVFIPVSLELQLARLARKQNTSDPLTRLGVTKRQHEVLLLMHKGLINKQIAKILFITEETVKFHVSALLKILNAGNRTECIVKATAGGLLTDITKH
jgi:two-component system nitrate/nitrite response regulator NarL